MASYTPSSSAMSGEGEDAITHLSFEPVDRAFGPMPVVAMLDVNGRRVELLADIPPDGRRFDPDMDDVSSSRDVTVNQHENLPELCRTKFKQDAYAGRRNSVDGSPTLCCKDVTSLG